MIEKMKAVCVAAQSSRRDELLYSLRRLGVLHIAEKGVASESSLKRFAGLSDCMRELKGYSEKGAEQAGILSDEEFEKLHARVCAAFEKKLWAEKRIAALTAEAERIGPWGDFSPRDILSSGIEIHFYRVDKKEYDELCSDENVRFVLLKPVEKMRAVAVIGTAYEKLRSSEFKLPEKGLSELEREKNECKAEAEECRKILEDSARYLSSYSDQLLKAGNAVEFSSADASLTEDSGIVWITGYIPENEAERFSDTAGRHCWAWLMQDVSEDDADVPTKIRYNKLTALVKPLFDILGTVPGYLEYDISFWFLAFFSLFFAMIIGDAGYGAIFLTATVIYHIRTKKATSVILLLYVLSATTIVWGALTGTWFGLEGAMKVPFLKALVIPGFANYPEYFGIATGDAQNNVMRFCFSIGVIQLSLACVMNIKRKIKLHCLAWIADIGWLLSVCALYFLVLYLVIGEKINLTAVAVAVGSGFLLVVLFGGMSPGKTFAQGVKAGLGNAFTVFLNTISAFGNIMSYIRLFAVGMASLAIAQSFNDMASGFSGVFVIAAVVILLIGHAMNIVMGFLSIVVHGVRLNLLEFSGQLGMEWSGTAYRPFREMEKEKNQ